MSASNRFAVIGDPIAHSLSPVMQRAALEAAGIDGTYEAHRVEQARLGAHVARLREEGYRGFNVTIPHKENVFAFLDDASPVARQIGAVNTVSTIGGRLVGHNTDVPGFRNALATLDMTVEGRLAVVLGTGGAARAVVHALTTEGADIVVVSRSVEKGARMARSIGRGVRSIGYDGPSLRAALAEARLLVNTTPLGMEHQPHADPLPADVELRSHTAVVDLVYGRMTPLMSRARSKGCTVMDGIEMLVEQGAESFRLWTGRDPDLATMRRACWRHLEEARQCSVS